MSKSPELLRFVYSESSKAWAPSTFPHTDWTGTKSIERFLGPGSIYQDLKIIAKHDSIMDVSSI